MQEGLYFAQTSALQKTGNLKRLANMNFERLIAAVSTVCKVSKNQILGENRERRICEARRILAYLSTKMLDTSQTRVSELMDLDRSSVLYMVKRVEKDLANCDNITTDLIMDSLNQLNKCGGKIVMSRNKYEKSIVSFGMYDDGMLITIDGESIFHEMDSKQMVALAIELLERSQLSANLSEKKPNN